MRVVSVAILLMIGVLLLTVNVNAGTKIEEAEVAYGKGRDLFEQGKYVKAAGSFRKAYELKPNWKILYNIGQCEAAAKRHGLALKAFEEYLSRGGDDIPPERKDEVPAEISRLK
jgi:tetratricopeptide (TPR) repeat protein